MYKWARRRIFVHFFAFHGSQGKSSELAMFISEDVAKWQRGMVQNRHQSGWHFRPEDPLRQMMARKAKNLHISREIRPPPPTVLVGGGGGIVKSCLTVRAFLAFRQWPNLAEGHRSGGSNQVVLPDSEPCRTLRFFQDISL